jgi:excisionase family DNA binding protein
MKGKDAAKTAHHMSPVMTVRELSSYLHLHSVTVRKLARRHQIPAFRMGRDWRFNVEQIDRWRQQQENPHRERE